MGANTLNVVLFGRKDTDTFVSVFHRILDFKAGLDFYPGPFFMPLFAVYH
jgi:hypothetical protein